MIGFVPLALAATAAVVALVVGIGLLGRPSPEVGPSALPAPTHGAAPDPNATPEPDATPVPPTPLGGGLILVNSPQGSKNRNVDVFTLDAGTGQQTRLGTLPSPATRSSGLYHFQWTADRTHILITDRFLEPARLENPTAAAGAFTFVCCLVPDAYNWTFSPRGDRIAGTQGDGHAIVVVDVDGGGTQTLPLPHGAQVFGITWSPDGTAIATTGCRPCDEAGPGEPPTAVHENHMYIVPLDGSPVRELLDGRRARFDFPAWSPDGSTIAIAKTECPSGRDGKYCFRQARSNGTFTIVSFALADSRQTTLATGRDSLSDIAWSPDGRLIAYIDALGDMSGGIFVMNADGSHPHKLGDGSGIRWSPDGEWLLYSAFVDTGANPEPIELRIVAVDGGESRRLGTEPYDAGGW